MYVIIKKDSRIRRQKRFQREYRRYGPEAEEWADCAGERVRDAYDRLKSPSAKDAPGGRYDDLKLAIENMSGGANTVLLDDLGNAQHYGNPAQNARLRPLRRRRYRRSSRLEY